MLHVADEMGQGDISKDRVIFGHLIPFIVHALEMMAVPTMPS